MQKFQLVFSYIKTVDGKDETFYEETWCKTEKEALSRVHLKMPMGSKLQEAWFCEWQDPDAPMEPLWSATALSKPAQELKAMVANRRAKKTEPILSKAKRLAAKLTAKAEAKPVPKLTVKPAKKPYRPYTIFAAVSWRDWAASKEV